MSLIRLKESSLEGLGADLEDLGVDLEVVQGEILLSHKAKEDQDLEIHHLLINTQDLKSKFSQKEKVKVKYMTFDLFRKR